MGRPWTWWAGVVVLAVAVPQAVWSVWVALDPVALADLSERYAKEAATGQWEAILTFALSNIFWYVGSLAVIGFALIVGRTWMLLVAGAVSLISATLFAVPILEMQTWDVNEVHIALTGAVYVFALICSVAALISKLPIARPSPA